MLLISEQHKWSENSAWCQDASRRAGILVFNPGSKEGRGRLGTALKEVIGATGTVCHLIPRIEVEIADIEPSIKAEYL